MAMTPQQIAKAAIREMVEKDEKPAFAKAHMIALWQDAFPLVRYINDADVLAERRARAASSAKAPPTPTESLKADISFEEAFWGDDIGGDNTRYAGLGMESVEDAGPDAGVHTLNAHVRDGLTRTQLRRTGFKEHGGIVLTFLNPMLEKADITIKLGSHVYLRAQFYRIAETAQVVKWDAIKGHLYTAANCVIG